MPPTRRSDEFVPLSRRKHEAQPTVPCFANRMPAWAFAAFMLLSISASAAAPLRMAQLGPVGPSDPAYGYQPYNDRNPTGFYHPNGTGYGHYSMTPKYHGHRIRALHYRKFRGA